jgi:hypothetical protein
MTQNNNLIFEKRDSKYKYIKIEIPYKFIIGTGLFVGSYIIVYKNYNKICYYLNIFKNIFFFKLGYNLTNKCVKTMTQINNKNKIIYFPTINRAKTIKDIISVIYKGGSKFIKK